MANYDSIGAMSYCLVKGKEKFKERRMADVRRSHCPLDGGLQEYADVSLNRSGHWINPIKTV